MFGCAEKYTAQSTQCAMECLTIGCIVQLKTFAILLYPMVVSPKSGYFAKWRAPSRIPQVCSLVLQDISDVVSEFWRGMSDDTLSPLLISEAMRARGGLEERAKGWAATSSALGLNNPPWQVSRDSTKVWTKKSLPSPTHFTLVSRLNLLAFPAGLGGFSAFGVPSLNYSRPGLIESVSTENASASGPGDFKHDKQGIKIPPEMKIAPRYTWFTLLTLFYAVYTLKLLYTTHTVAGMPLYIVREG